MGFVFETADKSAYLMGSFTPVYTYNGEIRLTCGGESVNEWILCHIYVAAARMYMIRWLAS